MSSYRRPLLGTGLCGGLTTFSTMQVETLKMIEHRHWGLAVGCGREGLQALAARCHAEMEWVAKNAGTWLGHVRDQAADPLLLYRARAV